jgi:peptidoglycan hydrolase CwlO-like protein
MRKQIIIAAVVLAALTSCNGSRKQENPEQETPKALEDKNSSFTIASKRGPDDLVESLYNELADKTPELKKLEDKIDDLNKSKTDSTESFDKYNEKNQSYYSAANSHLERITDSLLRDKMKILVANSLAKYNSLISTHTDLLKSINTNSLTLSDLHTILKITRTVPLIEKYQKDKLPSAKSLEGFSKRLDEAINYTDTLIKK